MYTKNNVGHKSVPSGIPVLPYFSNVMSVLWVVLKCKFNTLSVYVFIIYCRYWSAIIQERIQNKVKTNI